MARAAIRIGSEALSFVTTKRSRTTREPAAVMLQ
jgi:hypothetical protein